MNGPALVPITQAAKELGLGRTTAYSLARETGELAPGIPLFHIRKRWFANRAQLDKFLAGETKPAVAS